MAILRTRVRGGGRFGDWLNALADMVAKLAGDWISAEAPLEMMNGPDGVAIRLATRIPKFIFVRLEAALYRDNDSAGAVPQRWIEGDDAFEDDPDAEPIDISGVKCYGYFFADDIVEVREIFPGIWKPTHAGSYHFEGTGATIAQGATGSITLTQSRGSVTATARYGDVVSGDLVSLHWDNDEGLFFIGDSECSA